MRNADGMLFHLPEWTESHRKQCKFTDWLSPEMLGEDRVKVGSSRGYGSPPPPILCSFSLVPLNSPPQNLVPLSYPLGHSLTPSRTLHLAFLLWFLGILLGVLRKGAAFIHGARNNLISEGCSLISPATRPKVLRKRDSIEGRLYSVNHLESRFYFSPSGAYLSLRKDKDGVSNKHGAGCLGGSVG